MAPKWVVAFVVAVVAPFVVALAHKPYNWGVASFVAFVLLIGVVASYSYQKRHPRNNKT